MRFLNTIITHPYPMNKVIPKGHSELVSESKSSKSRYKGGDNKNKKLNR